MVHRLTLIVLIINVVAAPAHAMPVPPKIQAMLFTKILAYDRAIGKQKGFVVLVVKDDAGVSATITTAFTKMGIDARETPQEALRKQMTAVDAVYVTPGVPVDPISKLCERFRKLSMTGVPALVVSGEVSVGLGTKDNGRPQIIVNLLRADKEKRGFEAGLLSIARVIK